MLGYPSPQITEYPIVSNPLHRIKKIYFLFLLLCWINLIFIYIHRMDFCIECGFLYWGIFLEYSRPTFWMLSASVKCLRVTLRPPCINLFLTFLLKTETILDSISNLSPSEQETIQLKITLPRACLPSSPSSTGLPLMSRLNTVSTEIHKLLNYDNSSQARILNKCNGSRPEMNFWHSFRWFYNLSSPSRNFLKLPIYFLFVSISATVLYQSLTILVAGDLIYWIG